jgi:hypothetical protein
MAIIRSWTCENSRCRETFDSWNANPECPKCGCVRVNWLPAGGHVGKAGKAGDAELRALADIFKMPDMNSAERGRAAKKVNLPPASPPGSGPVHTFQGGFSAAVNPAMGAQCVPTSNSVDFKVKATPGNRLGPGALGLPGVHSHTAVEAAYKGGA